MTFYLGYNPSISSKFRLYNGISFGSKISIFDIGDAQNQISLPTLLSTDLIPTLDNSGNILFFMLF